MRVLGIALITNAAAGISGAPLDHEEVIAAGWKPPSGSSASSGGCWRGCDVGPTLNGHPTPTMNR
jgi:hypothetical protein